MLLVSCTQKTADIDVNPEVNYFTIRATAEENAITKGTFDSKGAFKWTAGDEIVAYRVKVEGENTYKWYEPMSLVSGGCTGEGTFRAFNGDQAADKMFSVVAFYPRFGTGANYSTTDYTNYSESQNNLYFHLLPEMAYSEGMHPMPLATAIAEPQAGDKDLKVQFSQVGAGVKVSLSNVPAKANKISLTVADKKITGWFSVSVPSIGTNNGFITNSSQGDGSTVTYTFDTASAARNMEFVFPMPTTELPSLELNLYIKGESLPVWSVTTPEQPALRRGYLLDMPKLALAEPYYVYLLDESKYYKMYVFGNEGKIFGEWPGKVQADSETVTVGGVSYNYCHCFAIPAKYKGKTISIVFNGDGEGAKTPDITGVTLGKQHTLYFLKDGTQKYNQ